MLLKVFNIVKNPKKWREIQFFSRCHEGDTPQLVHGALLECGEQAGQSHLVTIFCTI